MTRPNHCPRHCQLVALIHQQQHETGTVTVLKKIKKGAAQRDSSETGETRGSTRDGGNGAHEGEIEDERDDILASAAPYLWALKAPRYMS